MTLTHPGDRSAADGLEFFVGGADVSPLPLPPFDPRACAFLSDVSARLRADPAAQGFPDLQTFAFWCRSANLQGLSTKHGDGRSRLGLGLLYHITPANVPVNFAYSFAFGLLAGNANIVRAPSRDIPQIDLFARVVAEVLGSHPTIKGMTAFVRHPHDDKITGLLSARCNGRIVWGGDATVRAIRAIPRPERSIEIAFPDRYSFCIIDADAVVALAPEALARLADGFYNDTYLMDQDACSSPHLVIWLGSAASKQAGKEKFWQAVRERVAARYRLEEEPAVEKYTRLLLAAADGNALTYVRQMGNEVYTVGLARMPDSIDILRGRYGLFYEYDTEDRTALAVPITAKFQTLTYFGVDPLGLRDLVIGQRAVGIDRIVPVGQALDIGLVWDGLDIISTLSRIIDVR